MNPEKIVDQLSLWKKYRTGMCNGCWSGCCTLPVEVTILDLIRMELISEDEAAGGSLKKIARSLAKQGVIKSFRATTGIFILEQRHGRDCIYLDDDRRCTIYDKRPDVCRRFPEIGPRPGHCPVLPKKMVTP